MASITSSVEPMNLAEDFDDSFDIVLGGQPQSRRTGRFRWRMPPSTMQYSSKCDVDGRKTL